MIWGLISRRRVEDQPFTVKRIAAIVLQAAARTFSNADPSLLGAQVARRAPAHRPQAQVSLVSFSAARRAPISPAPAAPSALVMTAARKMNLTPTTPLVSRAALIVVHK